MTPPASQPENPPPTAIPLATFATPVPVPTDRIVHLGPKLKFSLVAALFVGSLLCCFVTTWFTASERAARLERERITQELKGDLAIGKQGAKPAEQGQAKKADADTKTMADDEPSKSVADATVKSSAKQKQILDFVDVGVLHPSKFALGQRGTIIRNPQSDANVNGGSTKYWFEVDMVLSNNEVLIRENQYVLNVFNSMLYKSPRVPIIRFIVEMPTMGLANNARIELRGTMEVFDIREVKGKTCFVLRSIVPGSEREAREAKQKVYTREEFRELVKDKGTDAVIAAVGRPDKSEESVYKAKNPGSGLLENHPIMFWTFENRTRDPFTGKIDSRAVIEFRGEGFQRVVYVVRFQ